MRSEMIRSVSMSMPVNFATKVDVELEPAREREQYDMRNFDYSSVTLGSPLKDKWQRIYHAIKWINHSRNVSLDRVEVAFSLHFSIAIIQSRESDPEKRRSEAKTLPTRRRTANSRSRLEIPFFFLFSFIVHFHLSLYNGRDDMDNELNEI